MKRGRKERWWWEGESTEERKREDGEEMEKCSRVTKGGDRQLAEGSKQKRDDRQVRVRSRERTEWDDEEPGGGTRRRRRRRGSGNGAGLPFGRQQVG